MHPNPHKRLSRICRELRSVTALKYVVKAEKKYGREGIDVCGCGRGQRFARWCWRCWDEMLAVLREGKTTRGKKFKPKPKGTKT